MNPSSDSNNEELPVYEPEEETHYSLEIIAQLSGVDSTTILRYREQGLLSPNFDQETLRRIKRIRHLETEYEAGPPAAKLILELNDELESLRNLLSRH